MKRILFSLLALGAFSALSAAPVSYLVTVDSSSIAPATAGFIEFQFNQANAMTSLAAMAYVDNFTSVGFTFDNGANAAMGGVTGSLQAPPLVFDNTGGGSNLFDQAVTEFGTVFSFILTLDGPALNSVADDGSEFFVYLLASDYSVLIGPTNGAGIASVAINGDSSLTEYALGGFSTITAVPEPATLWTVGLGGLVLLVRRFRR